MAGKCGNPTRKEITGEKTDGYYRGSVRAKSLDATRRNEDKTIYRGSYSEISESIEIWEYNCGLRGFGYTLIFVGHTLERIEQGDFGTGDSDCIGAEKRKKRQRDKNIKKQELKEKQLKELRLNEKAYFYDKKMTKGKISLSGSPVGAEIYIDGNYVGYIPCTFPVETGYHKVIVKKVGYTHWEQIIEVESGETYSTYIDLTEVDTY